MWQWNLNAKSEIEGLWPYDFDGFWYKLQKLHRLKRRLYFCLLDCDYNRLSIFVKFANMQNQVFPDEILLKIFSYLHYPDLGRCAQVSKKMQSVCFDESLKYHLMIDAYQNYSPFIKVLLQVNNFQTRSLCSPFYQKNWQIFQRSWEKDIIFGGHLNKTDIGPSYFVRALGRIFVQILW